MRKLADLMDLSGRAALVTGGAGHVGYAACEALAELGCAVIILDRDPDACAEMATRLAGDYGKAAFPLALDLNDESALRKIPQFISEKTGRLDILILCAAFVGTSNLTGWAVPFAEQSVETWRAALEVNLTAAFALSQLCTPLLHDSGHGAIINVASIYGMVGPDWALYEGTALGNPAAYAASKGGLLQLTRWLATTLAPDIRVNAITPGGIWRGQDPVFVDRYVRRTPLGRMGIEEEMKGAFAYLASDLSAYVTGQTLAVDGGWTAW